MLWSTRVDPVVEKHRAEFKHWLLASLVQCRNPPKSKANKKTSAFGVAEATEKDVEKFEEMVKDFDEVFNAGWDKDGWYHRITPRIGSSMSEITQRMRRVAISILLRIVCDAAKVIIHHRFLQ